MDTLTYTDFPRQKLPYSEKTDAWRRKCVDSVIGLCNAYGQTRRSSNRMKQRNYNLLNNKIDKRDFDSTLNPLKLSQEALREFNFPATVQPYDVISPFFNLLFGEESKRMFTPVVRAINKEAISAKQQLKQKEILETFQSILGQVLNPEEQDPENPDPFKMLQKYQNYTPKEMRESVSEKLLTYYRKYHKLDDIWSEGWTDALVAGEELYCIERFGDGPRVRRVNPMELSFRLPNNSCFIDESEQIYEINKMSISEIIDEFYEYLTEEQIDDLERYQSGSATSYQYGISPLDIMEVSSIYEFAQDYNERGIDVHRTRWKSKKKVGSWHYLDENGEEQEELVEETFKINKRDKTQWIEWFWINEYWEGTRIGKDIYLNMGPRKQQFRTMDNPSVAKSGYVGTVYSAQNSQSVSLMDRVYPWVALYLIVWYRTELALAKNLGKFAKIDTSLMPDDWEMDKWLLMAQQTGILLVDSYNEGEKAQRYGTVNQSQQMGHLDLETGQYIQGHISLLDYIKEQIKQTSGITDQRLGAIQASELVGNTERAVTQSSHITERWFTVHNRVKVRVCEALIEVAKDCMEYDTKRFQYITDDLSTVLFEVQGDDFCDADYGVFVGDAVKDTQALDTLKGLLESAIQNQAVKLSQVVDILNSESISDSKHKLLQAEEENAKQAQEAERMKLEAEQQAHAEEMEMKRTELELEQYKIDQDNETKIRVAQMQALGIDEGSNTTDILTTAESALKEREIAAKALTEHNKMLSDRISKEKELALKDKEIQNKQEIERLKIKQTEVQNKSQEKMQDKELKAQEKELKMKERELQMKEKIERLKIKSKPKPAKKTKK